MGNRTALKVAALAGGAVVVFFLLRWLVSMLVRLVTVVGVALVAALAAYLAYRVWSRLAGGDATATDDAAVESEPAGAGPLADLEAGRDTDADADELSDEEFRRELDELTDER